VRFRLSTPPQTGPSKAPLDHRQITARDDAGADRPHPSADARRGELRGATASSEARRSLSARTAPETARRDPASPVDRRTALRVAGAGTLGALALAATAACADETVHDPDPLLTHELQARADAAAANAAIALAPHLQPVLATIAAQRGEHAEVLAAEIARLVGVYGDGTTPVRRTRTPTATPAPVSAPTVEQLRQQLARSQRAAAETAVALSGYRAGLLASISAACAVHAEGLATA